MCIICSFLLAVFHQRGLYRETRAAALSSLAEQKPRSGFRPGLYEPETFGFQPGSPEGGKHIGKPFRPMAETEAPSRPEQPAAASAASARVQPGRWGEGSSCREILAARERLAPPDPARK